MESIVDYADSKFGSDAGIYTVICGIVILSLIIRQVTIFLLPKLVSRAREKSERFAQIELNARNSIATAIFGLISWKLLEGLPQIDFSGTVILWCFTISKIIFLVFIIRSALKMIDGITIAFGIIDKDGKLDTTERTLISALESLMRFIIFVFGILFISETFGFDITTLIAGLGIGGLALALAAKDSISNIFGAITVLIDQPFKVGDWIIASGIEGEVLDIRVRTTLVRTSTDTIVTLPNASLVSSSVENFGKRRWRRYQPLLHLDLDTEPDSIESFCKAIEERINQDNKTTNKDSSFATLEAISAQSIDIKLNVYWNVDSGIEERIARQALLLDITRFAKERKIDFFEPRVRNNR